jgi:hypothetical protein
MHFTPAQAETILDRLERATDCILEVLTIDDPRWRGQTALVRQTAHDLAFRLSTKGRLPLMMNELEREILRDAIEGSTYLAQLWGSSDPSERLAYQRRLRSMNIAVAKLRALGVQIRDIPTC